MKLGIMSDSHGHAARVRAAVEALTERGATAFVHCGDVGGLNVLEELAGRPCWFVWGNTDWPQPSWRTQIEAMDLAWPDGPLDLTLAGRRVAVFHGHERGFSRALDAADQDYLLHGHTHQRIDYRVGGMRIINPGALHRARVHTVALLDLATDTLEYIEITV